jgi:tRNA-binding protein
MTDFGAFSALPGARARRPEVTLDDFLALDIRAGVVLEARAFPEARKPALQLEVDFGPGIGVLPSSAQLTRRYDPEDLVGTRVLGVVNLPPLRIAGFESRCLVLGVVNPDDPGDVVLVRPDGVPGLPPGWLLG